MLVRNEVSLHLFFLDLRNVSLALLPPRVAFDANMLALLQLFRTIAIAFVKQAIIARLFDAAGVLPLGRQLHLQFLNFRFDILDGRLCLCPLRE